MFNGAKNARSSYYKFLRITLNSSNKYELAVSNALNDNEIVYQLAKISKSEDDKIYNYLCESLYSVRQSLNVKYDTEHEKYVSESNYLKFSIYHTD